MSPSQWVFIGCLGMFEEGCCSMGGSCFVREGGTFMHMAGGRFTLGFLACWEARGCF